MDIAVIEPAELESQRSTVEVFGFTKDGAK